MATPSHLVSSDIQISQVTWCLPPDDGQVAHHQADGNLAGNHRLRRAGLEVKETAGKSKKPFARK